jgi:integrase
MYGLEPINLKKFFVSQKPVFIPLELEIDQLIASCTRRVSTYLSLLKDLGLRPIEAWSMLFTDIDTKQRTINIRTAKHGVPRILPLSDGLIDMLFGLKGESKYIFAVGTDPIRFPKELAHFTRNYLDRRKLLAVTLNNPRINQISLYTFRHFRATMLYLATRDLYHCKWWLGHSRIENTMKYVNIANAMHRDTGNYTCKVAKALNEATDLIAQGFEYVTEMDGAKIFRKRK